MPFQTSAALSEIASKAGVAGPELPLQGLTILAVEDSRYACEALRLICQRSGARLRRAETLEAAASHLRLYRPDVVLVDLGLPDGRGEGLIRQLALARAPTPVVLGMSGDPAGRPAALAAGAAGFLDKPIEGLAAFQRLVLAHLPGRQFNIEPGEAGVLRPDRLALRDDLAHAAALIAAGPDDRQRRYLSAFVGGLARSLKDSDMARAADAASEGEGLPALAGLLSHRLEHVLEPAVVEGRDPTAGA
jgi:DNA-binding NarL/FixJ family response regulator